MKLIGRNPARPEQIEISWEQLKTLEEILGLLNLLETKLPRNFSYDMESLRKAVPIQGGKIYLYKLKTNDYWIFTPAECSTIYLALERYLDITEPTAELIQYKLQEALEGLSSKEWLHDTYKLFKRASSEAGVEYL